MRRPGVRPSSAPPITSLLSPGDVRKRRRKHNPAPPAVLANERWASVAGCWRPKRSSEINGSHCRFHRLNGAGRRDGGADVFFPSRRSSPRSSRFSALLPDFIFDLLLFWLNADWPMLKAKTSASSTANFRVMLCLLR
jgi:hypothetical protein